MPIDLTSLPPAESERLAYAENFTMAAALFGKLVDAQHGKTQAAQHLMAVLSAATNGDTAALTRAAFAAYLFLEREGYDIAPESAEVLEHAQN